MPDEVTGTGVPGAVVTLLDETGMELTRADVAPDGTFTAALPGDALHDGMTVRAVQTDAQSLPSEPSTAIGPYVFPVPTVASEDGSLDATLTDVDGDGVGEFPIFLSGIPGETVIVAVDSVFTGNEHRLEAEPIERVVRNVRAGTHVIGIRYIDPVTKRVGRLESYTFTVTDPTASAP